MADKIILKELTKEELSHILAELEPGTILIIDMPEEKKVAGYAVGTQEERKTFGYAVSTQKERKAAGYAVSTQKEGGRDGGIL